MTCSNQFASLRLKQFDTKIYNVSFQSMLPQPKCPEGMVRIDGVCKSIPLQQCDGLAGNPYSYCGYGSIMLKSVGSMSRGECVDVKMPSVVCLPHETALEGQCVALDMPRRASLQSRILGLY